VQGCSVREVATDEYQVTCGSHRFAVALSTQPHVREEARELVESAGTTLPNPDEVATFDARFEILFPRDEIGDLFNPLLAIADELAMMTGGAVYEPDNDAFQ
jgi:hypothetical protein